MLINECNIEYDHTLHQKEVLIQYHPHSDTIIRGDVNTSLKGIMHRHAVSITSYYEIMLEYRGKVVNPKRAHTYVNYSLGNSSCIDHFAISMDIYDSMASHYVEC